MALLLLSVVKYCPRLVVNRGVHQALSQQIVGCAQHVPRRQARATCDEVQVHALVCTRRVGKKLVHLACVGAACTQLGHFLAPAVPVGPAVLVDKHTVAGTHVSVDSVRGVISVVLLAVGAQRPFDIVQVDVGGLELVVVDLVEAVDGADKMGADVALLTESLEAAPDAHPLIGLVLGVGILLFVGVDPLLDIDGAGAIIETVRDVGLLRVDGSHLTHDGHLRDGVTVDEKVGSGISLLKVEELLDGHGAQRLVGEALCAGAGRLGNVTDGVWMLRLRLGLCLMRVPSGRLARLGCLTDCRRGTRRRPRRLARRSSSW